MKKAVREGGLFCACVIREADRKALIITRGDEAPSSANAMDGCGTIMHACWNDAVEILPRLAILPRHRRGLARPFELCHARGASPRERAIGPNVTELKMTREGVCKAFGLSPELLEALESSAVLRPGEDGALELSDVAAGLFSYGIPRAKAPDEKLAAVASALNDALPALQRLSTLPDHAALEGEPRERVP